jgi:hypothetical protein
MKIVLENPITKQIVEPVFITLTELTIKRIVDLSEEKIVRVFIEELNSPLILWEGDSYDEIGQWTDSDVQSRIIELLNGL